MEELKPCPFCGSDRVFIMQEMPDSPDVTVYSAECLDCPAEMNPGFEDEQEIIATWNQRTAAPVEIQRPGVCKECGKTGSNYGCPVCFVETPATEVA